MNKRMALGLICLILAVWVCSGAAVAQGAGQVSIIPVKGEISPALAAFVRQEIEKAEAAGRDIILEIDTYGGYLDSAVQIKDAVFACRTNVSAFVNDKAISAGVLITISCNDVFMAPTASIGAAEVVPYSEKALSAWVGILRAVAQERGRDDDVIAAMADSRVVVDGVSDADTLLTLTAMAARQLAVCDEIYADADEAAADLGLSPLYVDESFAVKAANVLTSDWLSSILFAAGIICLIAEIFVPGFGVLGISGIACLGLYFFGGVIAGYAQWWAVILLVAGIALLVAEMFIPGFGVAGFSGLACLLAGVFFSAKSVRAFALVTAVSLVAVMLALPVFFRLFTKSRVIKRLSLGDSLSTDEGYLPAPDANVRVGDTAVAATDLRPSGVVVVDGRRFDAMSPGDFIAKNTRLRVTQVSGQTVRVEPAPEDCAN